MIERIVVPLDGSMTAEAILPQVRRVLYRKDSEIILVRSVPPPITLDGMTQAEVRLGAAREYLLGQAEQLEQQGVRVRSIVRIGSPVRVILEVVESEKGTMVALATHGTTGLRRFLFGSVAEGVIRKSPVPVLLVRPDRPVDLASGARTPSRPIRNLLVPVGDVALARKSVPAITEFAELFDTRVVLLRIFEGAVRRAVEAPENAGAHQDLEELAGMIEEKGIQTSRLLGLGNPVDRILEAVREQQIDLIAMTTHGRSGLSRIKAGSVTEAVLRRAEVPLLITRAPDGKPAPEVSRRVNAGR